MRRCLQHVFSFLMTYVVITLSFAFGLHFVLVWSVEECPQDEEEGREEWVKCRNGTRVQQPNST